MRRTVGFLEKYLTDFEYLKYNEYYNVHCGVDKTKTPGRSLCKSFTVVNTVTNIPAMV